MIKEPKASVPVQYQKQETPQFNMIHENMFDENFNEIINNKISDKQNHYNKLGQTKTEAILQLSSNSSQNYNLKTYQLATNLKNSKQMQLIYISQEGQLQKYKNWKERDKSKSVLSPELTNKISNAKIKGQNLTKKVFSSLGTIIDGNRKKTVFDQKQAEEDCKIYKEGCWSKTKLMITSDRLSFFQCTFQIAALKKIKIIPSTNLSKTKPQNIIKIQANNQITLFSLTMDKKFYQLPTAYFIFAKLIQKKMNVIQQIAESDWQKSEHIEKRVTEDSYIYGNIMKRSQHLGNWQSRFVVIKKQGIYSYKDSKQEESYSFFISSSSIKYLWTRFQMHASFLIIKIKHGLFKTQFGIPLTQFTFRSNNNWLYCFYRSIPLLVN